MMQRQHGFTLVELLVYVAIFTIVAGILSTIFFVIVNSQKKQTVSGEVVQQLNFVLATIQRLVGESSLVETVYEGQSASSTCSNFCTLKLRKTDAVKDPTIISSDMNGVYLKEGTSTQVTLTTNKILVNNLKFIKNEIAGGHAVVQISTSFSYNTNNPAFALTRAIESAVARVNAATFDADLLPNQDNTFNIGQVSPDLRWKSGRFAGDLTIGGNVGIGTTSPGAKLEVRGGIITNNSGQQVTINDGSPRGADIILTSATGNVLGFNIHDDSAAQLDFDAAKNLSLGTTGSYGWGRGNASTSAGSLGNVGPNSEPGLSLGGDTNLYRAAPSSLKTDSNVGIGTTPGSLGKLVVQASTSDGSTNAIQLTNAATNLLFQVTSAPTAVITLDLGGAGTGFAVCHTGGASAVNNVDLSDCTSAPSADYAEMYPVIAGVEAGDLVVTGSELVNTYEQNNGQVDWTKVKGRVARLIKSNQPYQSTLIGVISDNYNDFTSAGYNIRQEDNPKPVALNGRALVKVSSENGAVSPGDVLTASSKPGVAMKATSAGRVIGVALDSYDGESVGKIMVFVNPTWYLPGLSSEAVLNTNQESSQNLLERVGATIGNGILSFGKLIVEKLSVKEVNIQKNIILHAPNNSCFKVAIDNGGRLISTPIVCP